MVAATLPMSWVKISSVFETWAWRRNTACRVSQSLRRCFTAGRNGTTICQERGTCSAPFTLPPGICADHLFRAKEEGPEYPPPPPFIPLSTNTYQSQLPALFHSFFAARLENGLGLADDGFDSTHSQIGPLGQIVVKNPPAMKKKPEVVKKPKPVKVV